MEDQTHIGKLSGNDSGDFPETFAKKKSFSDIVTSLRAIIERGQVAVRVMIEELFRELFPKSDFYDFGP